MWNTQGGLAATPQIKSSAIICETLCEPLRETILRSVERNNPRKI